MSVARRTVGSHVNLGGFLRDQCGSLKEAFHLLDLRSTGQISREPFVAGLKRVGYQGEIEGIFEEMDTRDVGSITLREFIVHFTTRSAPQQPGLSRQGSSRELLEDTGSTGTGMRYHAMDDSARNALVEDVEARTRDQIDALRLEVKDLVETVRLEVGSVQAQHQSQHLMLLQAMHSRPLTTDVEQLVKSEVEQSAQEVSERLEAEVSNVGRLMKNEVDQAVARATRELEGRIGGSRFSAEANTGPGEFVSVSQLAGLESGILERVQTTLFNEFKVQFDSETTRLNSIMASTDTAVKQVSMLSESGLLSDLQSNLDKEMLKLQNRMLDTETQMMELSDDEALQKRCIPFFEDKIEAPFIAQEAMQVATEARGGIDALAKQLEKLQENVSLGNQKHEVFAERVMSGLQGLMSTIDSNSMPGLIEAPKLQSSSSASCIMSKPSSHSSLPGMSVNDVSVTWKSLGTSVTAKPGPPVHRIHSLPLGEASPQVPPQQTRASVHGAIQALRQDLMKFHSISDPREVPGSPEKSGFTDLDNFALRMSCSPTVPVPMPRSRSSAQLPQPGRAASPGVPVGCLVEIGGGVVTGPLLDPRAASPTRLSMPDRLASASPGVRNRVITSGAAAVCSVARVRSPQASPASMKRSVTPPRGFTQMVHSHSRTGLEKGRVSTAPPVAAVVARSVGSAKLPSYVSAPTQAWQQLSAIQPEQSLSRSATDQVTQASPACGRRTMTPPRKSGRQAAPAGQAAQSMRQPSFKV